MKKICQFASPMFRLKVGLKSSEAIEVKQNFQQMLLLPQLILYLPTSPLRVLPHKPFMNSSPLVPNSTSQVAVLELYPLKIFNAVSFTNLKSLPSSDHLPSNFHLQIFSQFTFFSLQKHSARSNNFLNPNYRNFLTSINC
jgi:hypothetical protein